MDNYRQQFELEKLRPNALVFASRLARRLEVEVPAISAEDIVQESYLKAIQNLSEFRGESSLKTWFYEIILKCYYDHCRLARIRQRKLLSVPDEMLLEVADDWDLGEEVIANEESALIFETLIKLKPQHRRVLFLYYFLGMSYKRIAEFLNLELGTLKSQINRAKRQFPSLYRQ